MTRCDISFDIDEFIGLISQSRVDTQGEIVWPGLGWKAHEIECPCCAKEMIFVVPVRAVGFYCVFCGYQDETVWMLPPHEIKHDGGYLVPAGWVNARTVLN